MRKISANFIFPVSSPPIKNGIIVIDDNGKIEEVIDTKGNLTEIANLEYYNGIIVPGFVNAHCHLELSHVNNNTYTKGSGLPEFIKFVNQQRHNNSENQLLAIKKADELMFQNGIKAVGDVSNNIISFAQKKASKIKYYNFIEIYSLQEQLAETAFQKAYDIYSVGINMGLEASIIPHAPYSLSQKLFKLIHDFHNQNKCIYSIHNQESEHENIMYQNGTGQLVLAFQQFGIDLSSFMPSTKTSLQSIADFLPTSNHTLLVHNIYTKFSDIEIITKTHDNLFWVLCPNSNLLIENKLPDIELFLNNKLTLAIGTDSMASNNSLSILDELKTLSKYFPHIPLEQIIRMSTLNGAKALGFDDTLGSIEKGKTPGLNLISNVDFTNKRLKEESLMKVLL